MEIGFRKIGKRAAVISETEAFRYHYAISHEPIYKSSNMDAMMNDGSGKCNRGKKKE